MVASCPFLRLQAGACPRTAVEQARAKTRGWSVGNPHLPPFRGSLTIAHAKLYIPAVEAVPPVAALVDVPAGQIGPAFFTLGLVRAMSLPFSQDPVVFG